MKTLSPFESMQWLKTLSSSKCKWRHCRLLKACNDQRHCRLRNVNEGIVAFWRNCHLRNINKGIVAFWEHEMSEDIIIFEKGQMTIICLYVPSDLIVSGWWRKRMTIICLCVPMDSLVSGRQREIVIVSVKRHWSLRKGANDHNLSLSAIGLDCLWMAKEADNHNLSLRANGLACLWKAKGDCNSLGWKTLKSSKRGKWP